ncbi:MAG: endo-1,4-beta-xylanase [Sedimentisphaerales bacterium]|nr:endo-1,4-beta-xylanase [Sedimentisphaerales bacterium]
MKLKKFFQVFVFAFLLLAAVSCCGSDTASLQPALKDAYKNDFLIGAALNDNVVNGNDPNAAEIVEKQFSAITAENVMKWQIIHPSPGDYNFAPADRFVEFGLKNKMFIVGHTLVWHHQTPLWIFKGEDGNDVDRETLLARMKDHIFTVMGRYKGKVNGWDVVNEALSDDGRLRRSKWLTIIGEDFIEKAFEFAHEADPDAELYYNDYSLENPGKCQGAVRIVKNLQAKSVRIDAVGCQGQAWRLDPGSPSRKDIQNFIDSFSALGVKCMFTEMCIDVLPEAFNNAGADIRANAQLRDELNPYVDGLPNKVQQQLAHRYAELFTIFRENSKKISRVTLWGVYDGTSWLNYWPVRGRTSYPLLFDRKYQPKPAFFTVMKTAQTKP